jgi:hypothetical protein
MKIQLAKHIWSVICQSVLNDNSSGLVTLNNIIEKIVIESKVVDSEIKVLPINFNIVSLWEITEKTNIEIPIEFSISIVSPENKELNNIDVKFVMPEGKNTHKHIMAINGLPIGEQGMYHFKLTRKIGNIVEILSEVPLEVEVKLIKDPSK